MTPPAKAKFSDKLFGGVVRISIVRAAGAGFGLLFHLALARLYGESITGAYALSLTMLGILYTVSVLGTPTAVIRMGAEAYVKGGLEAVRAVRWRVLSLTTTSTGIFAIVFALATPWISGSLFGNSDLKPMLIAVAIVLPVQAWLMIQVGTLRAIDNYIAAFSFEKFFVPALSLLGLATLTALIGVRFMNPMWAHATAISITAMTATWICWRKLNAHDPSESGESLPDYKTPSTAAVLVLSLPMLLTTAMHFLMAWTDTFMLGLFRTDAEVGVYHICIKLMMISEFLYGAVLAIIVPRFAGWHAAGERRRIVRASQQCACISGLVGVPLVALYFFFGEQVLGFFGEGFKAGAEPLVILAAAHIISCMMGPSGHYLNMTDRQNILSITVTVSAIINIALNAIFIPPMGILGAAWATSISIVGWSAFVTLYIVIKDGFWPGVHPFVLFRKAPPEDAE